MRPSLSGIQGLLCLTRPTKLTNQTTKTSSVQQETSREPVVWPGVTIGFWAAIAMWLVWYPLHLPGLQLSPSITAPILLVVMIGMIARGTRLIKTRALVGGLIAGLTCSLINLLLLGNTLTQKDPITAEISFRENAPQIAGGFFLVSIVAGIIAGVIGSQLSKRAVHPQPNWLMRFAIAAVAALVPLVAIGGAVTSAGAGMAVPDWPGTYGQNMFLYPITLMEEAVDSRIFLEHTHRLFGTLVGLAVLTLAICTFTNRSSRFSKVLAGAVFVAVCIQGYFGAIRVEEISPAFGVIHGVFGQFILAAAVVLAASFSISWNDKLPVNIDAATGTRKWAALAIGALTVQLLMAVIYRHFGSGHALMTHIGFSVITLSMTVILAFNLMKIDKASGGSRMFKRMGMFLLHGVSLQMVLGILSLIFRPGGGGEERVIMHDQLEGAEAVPVAPVLFATAHQALGASLLACSILATAWTFRVKPMTENLDDL